MPASISFKNRFNELVSESEIDNKTKLAKNIGISYSVFKKINDYGIIPNTRTIVRIADYFDVSVEYLLGKTENFNYEKSENPQSFNSRFEELKQEKKLTVYELADIVHIHRNNMAQWKKKKYIPLIDDLMILADYFDVSLDYLLGRTDYKK